jgi:hypothetical protein
MAPSAGLLCILLHHLPERLDPSRQAEPIETRENLFHGFAHRAQYRWRQGSRSCDITVHGVASNAAPPFSTSAGTSPVNEALGLSVPHTLLANR